MRILIIRSAPVAQYETILTTIDERYGTHVDLTVLTSAQSCDAVRAVRPVEVIPYHTHTLGIFSLSWVQIRSVQVRAYDLVIIACRTYLGDGYRWIELLALLGRARRVERWNLENASTVVTGWSWALSVIQWWGTMVLSTVVWLWLWIQGKGSCAHRH